MIGRSAWRRKDIFLSINTTECINLNATINMIKSKVFDIKSIF